MLGAQKLLQYSILHVYDLKAITINEAVYVSNLKLQEFDKSK